MIKVIDKSRTLPRQIACESRCEFFCRKCNLRQKVNNFKCQCQCRRPIKHRASEKDYDSNPTTCACECDKGCDIGVYCKGCESIKSCVDDIVATCDEVVDTPQTTSIKSINQKDYYLPYTFFLAIIYLVLLIFNATVFYFCYLKQESLTQCLRSY